ncbi:histidine triad nucleotide-binding protein [Granulicella sp. dw_53]|uniref:histidine triad nucleotide-binding protein n=1 Tax=Granulicella sp. dw_53 TaxID=2719792 RepID=UPI001BD6AD8B|nr:histidine triad nucleotide-binding protein [Granulicella sp. dw_53]
MSSGCLFCKIITGMIPAQRVYEDEVCIAFPDINPQSLTHILVVPKEHLSSLAEAGPEHTELLGKLMAAAAEVARIKKLDRGYRVVVNTGAEGGQTVHHLHLHVLGGRHMGWPPG